MPIDTEQWRAQTGLFCASRVLLRPPRCKQPQPKVQADTLSLNMKFSLAVLLVTLRTGIFYASRALQLLCLIACHASRLLSSIVRLSCRRLRGVSVLLALCLVVVQMLLIMSGDVEENPGPPKIQTTSLGVSDLSCVLDELLDVSHNWFNLGLKLKLNPITLVCVRDQYPDPSTALREMLLLWLKKVDPPPTWEGLACALESRAVGEPRLAEQLRTKYCKTEGAAGGSVGQTVAATEEEQPSYPSKPIRRVCPAASKSYIPRPMTQKGGGLMRRKLSSTETHHSRHARVDPPPRRLPSTTSHIPQPIARKEVDPLDQQRKPLLIRRQRPAPHPPIYGPVPSFPAHTPVDQYASYLRSVYTSKKLPTYSKWPPSSSKKFINLAVVRKETVSKKEADEFTRATIHGTEIDNIYQRKEAVDFSRVGKLKDGSLAKLILVEGAPGIGKTTFAWEVCRKWASGEILQEYGLVVLLRLRDKRVCEVKTIFDLFHHPNPELSSAVGKEILYHEGESVLLLYEGYDELPRKLQEQQSVFLDVLHKNYLPRATILITSRPSATAYLRWEFQEQISQHIEILGFTKDDIISYVHDVIKDEQVCRDFHQYLKCYPYIRGMMYVPLNAVIVTEVYKSSQQSPEKFIPTTMTELYTALTRSLLLRYLHSHSEYGQQKWNLKSFTDLPRELYKQFCDVTAVALKGMIEDTFVFDDLPHDFNTLDLMQSVPELYVEQGALVSYNFFHLTLQEYLAAVNISQQPVEKQIEFFQTSDPSISESMTHPFAQMMSTHAGDFMGDCTYYNTHPTLLPGIMDPKSSVLTSIRRLAATGAIPIPSTTTVPQSGSRASSTQPSLPDINVPGISTRLRNVLRFVAGLTKFKGVPVATLQPLVLKGEDMTLKSLHWLFETQCSDTYNKVVSPYRLFTEHRSNMSPFDYFVLGYAMAHITSHWKINFCDSKIDNDDLEMLVAGVNFERDDFAQSEENRALQQLDISINSIGDGGTTALAGILENRMLQQLDVSSNSIGVAGATALAAMLKENRTLQQLNISHNFIGDGGTTALAAMLKENRTLQQLNISHNSIGDGGTTALVAMLKENKTLQQLNVSFNSICYRGATALAKMLNENRTLQQLDVSHNSIDEGGATALAEKLKENRALQQLNVSNNSIHDGGATALAEMLKENRMLQQLNVSSNSIGDGGATALAEMLKENRTLQQLNVSHNFICDGGATALAEKLKENRTLQQLNVSHNSIHDGGATALAEMLKENRLLQQLDVSYNWIGNGGATALAEVMKQNKTVSIIL